MQNFMDQLTILVISTTVQQCSQVLTSHDCSAVCKLWMYRYVIVVSASVAICFYCIVVNVNVALCARGKLLNSRVTLVFYHWIMQFILTYEFWFLWSSKTITIICQILFANVCHIPEQTTLLCVLPSKILKNLEKSSLNVSVVVKLTLQMVKKLFSTKAMHWHKFLPQLFRHHCLMRRI